MAGHIADSSSIDWCSPLWITDGAHELWKATGGIHLDPCGNPGSKARVRAPVTFMLPERNGLKLDWAGWSFVNDAGEKQDAENVYVNSPFGQVYMHKETKELVLPSKLKQMCDLLVEGSFLVPGAKRVALDRAPNAAEKRKQRELRDQYEASEIGDWLELCAMNAQKHDMQVIQLGPANVDTIAWHEYVEKTANAVMFPKGRIYFELVDFRTGEVISTGPAPMACALAYWGRDPVAFARIYHQRGAVHILR